MAMYQLNIYANPHEEYGMNNISTRTS